MKREQAIALYETEWWKGLSDYEIVKFQLFERLVCMPFGEFHRAVESVLNRPVFTHEFACYKKLQDEFLGDKPAPTFEEIINIIPIEKRMAVLMTQEIIDADALQEEKNEIGLRPQEAVIIADEVEE